MDFEHCIYCQSGLYHLQNGMVKCVTCKRKYSLEKVSRDASVIEAFVASMTVLQASERLDLSYQSVATRYDRLRRLAAGYLEHRYESEHPEAEEFEEYIYLEASKRQRPEEVFDAHNFITFGYGEQVYNVLLPSLRRFKNTMSRDGVHEPYYREFKSFMRDHHIAKLRHRENTITRFWTYFEDFIKPFKGVSPEHFGLYLKEAEFKFNYNAKMQRKILQMLWFANR